MMLINIYNYELKQGLHDYCPLVAVKLGADAAAEL